MYDNLITSDHLEQVVQKIQDTKASKSTTLSGYGITDSYTKTETDNRIQDIVGAAPEALDTLEEIAEALQDGESTAAGLVQTLSQKADKSTTVTTIAYGSKKLTKTINGSTTDVVTINAIKSDLALTKSDVGLSNVDNTSDANKPVSNATQTALDTKVDKVSGKGLSTNDYTTSEKNKLSGIASNAQVNIIESIKVNNSVLPISSKSVNITVPTKTSELTNNSNFAVDSNYVHTDNNYTTAEKQKLASKVAELDSNGKVLSSQLPSYVDDVVEYASSANFPTTGESGKIYVDTGANLTYRWTGSAYREISPSLALGETSSTAYRGDRGKVAYTHATDSNRLTTAKTSGLYKISTTAEGHVASAETAGKSDVGLGNVDNTSDLDKPISTATQEALNTKVNVTTSVLKSDEEFTYRQTGDGSLDIDTKYGKLKSIKGRTLVWNQKVTNPNFANSSLTGWAFNAGQGLSFDNRVLTITGVNGSLYLSQEQRITLGHKYYISMKVGFYNTTVSPTLYNLFVFYGSNGVQTVFQAPVANSLDKYSAVITADKGGYQFGFSTYPIPPGATLKIDCDYGINIIDLTTLFGAGNEPATVADFEALYSLPYYAYNPGELINNGLQSEYDLVWNQLVNNGNFANNTTGWTANNTATISTSSGVASITTTGQYAMATNSVTLVDGHKYYFAFSAKLSDTNLTFRGGVGNSGYFSTEGLMIPITVSSTSETKRFSIVSQYKKNPASGTSNNIIFMDISSSTHGTLSISNVVLFDLTLMFGAGNEPVTPEEFEAMFPNDYYPYDAGTQRHFSFPQFKTKIETVGWNIWDEELEKGDISTSTGQNTSSGGAVRSKNYVSVKPGQTYYLKIRDFNSGCRVFYYGSNKEYQTNEIWAPGSTHTIGSGTNYIRFQVAASLYGEVYTNDICVNLSDPSRNGTYEPYWRSELELGLGDIKVKSHNIWDEEWENNNGGWNYIMSKNYCDCKPNTAYYIHCGTYTNQYYTALYFYDENKVQISYTYACATTVTSPANARYFKVKTNSQTYVYGNQYLNDICVNESDPAFNGRYEPYGDGGVISITGGLKSAGTVYDEISGGKFVKRIESVDLGSMTWSYNSSYGFYANGPAGIETVLSTGTVRAVTPRYTVSTFTDVAGHTGNMKIAVGGYPSGTTVIVNDDSYTDAATFKAAVSGVPLYYELAQPIEYELYNPIDLSYKVDKFGTEKLLPESTSAIVSSPFIADIEYRTTNVTIDDVYGGSDIIKSVEDVNSRLTTVEKSINGLVTIGSGSPTTIPKNIGDFYIDVTNKVLYFATGNQLISDWNS